MSKYVSRYSKEWKAIAIAVKEAANWKCQECGIDCSQPEKWRGDRYLQAMITLTVHHVDFNSENDQPDNLIALCIPCSARRSADNRLNITLQKGLLFSRFIKEPKS